MAKKKVLILGAAGFVGSNLVRNSLAEDAEVTAVDSLEPLLKSTMDSLAPVLPLINFIKGDIRDQQLLREVVPGQDIIFNCAAQTSHPLSVQNPVLDTEITCIGQLRVLEAMRDYNPRAIFVYPSSTTVVGKAVGDLIDENHGERPLDIYSANKGVAEKYCRIFHKVYDLKTVVLRFPNLYGPLGKNDPAFGFINYFIHQAASDKPIEIWGEGLQTRNVMFIDDVTDMMWHSADYPKLIGETYFAVHDDHHTVREVAEAIVNVFGRGRIDMKPWPDFRKRIEIERVLFSGARLHYHTGWRPKYFLSEGLKLTKQRMEKGY
ncbi:MAG: NAD-dependent epimerase/dehydratase family protein [bacterium]|nr:NAD-dependent epimerase/dehydratase family protein [bacterium]